MTFDQVILWIMAIGILIGALDKILGNRFGLGERFDEGFHALGPLALGMTGIYCFAPVLSELLGPLIIPAFTAIGADPAMFGSILANDMGGYPLAMQLAQNEQAGLFSGLIVSSMFGCTLVFSIPVGLSLIEKNDEPYFFKGILIGLTTIPFGSFIGGWAAGFDQILIIKNLIPIVALSVGLIAGLYLIPDKMIKASIIMGRFIMIICYIGLAFAAFEYLTKVEIIPGMTPIMEVMGVVAGIGIVLLGTFPILSIIVKVLDRPLNAVGRKMGMDAAGTAGLVFSLANSIPVYKIMKDMGIRGKIVNTAWLVPATAALGDHLGFTAGVRPDMITPVVLGKLSAGMLAIILALLMTKKDATDKTNC